jgi:hypothetical protein
MHVHTPTEINFRPIGIKKGTTTFDTARSTHTVNILSIFKKLLLIIKEMVHRIVKFRLKQPYEVKINSPTKNSFYPVIWLKKTVFNCGVKKNSLASSLKSSATRHTGININMKKKLMTV